jgi:hypothetical protein
VGLCGAFSVDWRPDRFVRSVARFAIPAGTLTGVGLTSEHLFAVHDLDLTVNDARTVAVTILDACGLYLVLALEGGGSRKRSGLVAVMCALLAGLYVMAALAPVTRRFFELKPARRGHDRHRGDRQRDRDRSSRRGGVLGTRGRNPNRGVLGTRGRNPNRGVLGRRLTRRRRPAARRPPGASEKLRP